MRYLDALGELPILPEMRWSEVTENSKGGVFCAGDPLLVPGDHGVTVNSPPK